MPNTAPAAQVDIREKRITVNWVLVAILAVLALISAGLLVWRYHSQSDVVAKTYYIEAQNKLEDEDWRGASDTLYRYLRFQPRDEGAWYDLASAYAKLAKNDRQLRRAIGLHYQAIGMANSKRNKAELSQQLAELLLESGETNEALVVAGDAIKLGEEGVFDTPKARRIEAIARFKVNSLDRSAISEEVTADLRESLQESPGDIELATMAAVALRDTSNNRTPEPADITAANQIMDEMVAFETNADQSSAWLARHAYRRDYKLDGAEEDLTKAIELAKDLEDQLRTGIAALQWALKSPSRRDYWLEQSIKLLATVVDDNKRASMVAYLRLGDAYMKAGKKDEAIKTWTVGIKQFPTQCLDIHIQLAKTYLQDSDLESSRIKAREQIAFAHQLVDELSGMVSQYETRRFLVNIENTVELLDAELLLAEAKVSDAKVRAEKLSDATEATLDLLATMPIGAADEQEGLVRYSAYLLLGQALEMDRRFSEAADAYDAASETGIDDGYAALLAARIRHEQGNTNNAVRVMERAAERIGDAELWFTVAELHYDKQVTIPSEDRDWGPFERACDVANKIDGTTWHTPFWQAARAVADRPANFRDQALKLLNDAEDTQPTNPIAWYRIALAYQDLDSPAKADAAQEQFKSLEPPQWQATMLAARLAAARGNLPAAILRAEQATLEGPDEAEPPRRLVQYLLANGDSNKAREIMEGLYFKSPDDIQLLQDLAELDLMLGNYDKVEQWEERFREHEGEQGTLWRLYAARRLMAQQPSVTDLVAATTLQQEIEKQRRSWAPGWILRGDILMRHEKYAEAASSYRRAEALGARNLGMYERLLSSLYRSQQYEEATRYMRQLELVIPKSKQLFDLSTAVLSKTERVADAIRRAQVTVDAKPDDALSLIWLAQLYVLDGRDKEAADALTQAVRMESNELAPWLALFQFYSERRPQLAAKVLKRIEKQRNNLSSDQYALMVGQGWEQLGQTEVADGIYQEAIKLQPRNVELRLVRARMLFTAKPDEAERELRTALEINSESVPARQLLATLLSVRGSQSDWEEVRQLLSSERLGDGETATDRRLWAVLLTQRGGIDNLQKARATLESLIAEAGTTTPVDHMLLANAHESEGNFAGARAEYETLCENSTVPTHLVAIVRFLIRNNHADEAERWVEKLESVTREGPLRDRLVSLTTKARWLTATDRREEAKRAVEIFGDINEPSLESDVEKKLLYAGLGQIHTIIQAHELAEPWYQKLYELDPTSYRPLAIGLAQLNRHNEAIDLVIEKMGTNHQQVLLLDVLINILSAGQASDEAWSKTDSIWNAAESDRTDDTMIRMFASAARAMQGDDTRAIEIMNALRTENPDSPLVLNNLATLLGQSEGKQSEALAYIDRAIEIAGPKPSLLDTKSVILVEMGKADEAVKLLKHLVAIPQPDPRILLRLAVAYMRSNSPAEASKFYRRALDAGLESQVLTKRDRELMKELSEL